MNTTATDATYQAAWSSQRYASAMLGLPGPLRPEFRAHWQTKEKAALAAMAKRERELQP